MNWKMTLRSFTQSDTGLSLPRQENAACWEKVSRWFALIILTVFPFLMGTNGYYNITESRFFWFLLLATNFFAACLMVPAGYLLLFRDEWKQRMADGLQKPTVSQYLMFAYVLWAALSALLSPYRAETWMGQGRYEGLVAILLYSFVFICLSFWAEYTNKYVCGLAIMASVMAVISILQPLGVDLLEKEGYTFWSLGFFGTIGNVDCVSGVGAMVIPAVFCGYLLLESKWRYLCLTGLALYFYLQLYIQVDSGMVGLIAAFAVLLPFIFCNPKRAFRAVTAFGVMLAVYAVEKFLPITQTGVKFAFGAKALLALILGIAAIAGGPMLAKKGIQFPFDEKKMRRLVAGVVVLVFVIGLVFLYNYQGDALTLREAGRLLHGEFSDEMGNGRMVVWKFSLKLIKEMPLFGSGPDTYLSRAYPYYEQGIVSAVFDFAHNDFLQVAVCLGLGGLAIYLAWIFSMAIRLLKNAPANPLLLIFLGAMVGYWGHVFFSFSIALVTPIFWVMAGIADKLMRQMAAKSRNAENTAVCAENGELPNPSESESDK